MKRLLLTSAGMSVKEEILKILPKPASDIKLAHIITAAIKEQNKSYYLREKEVIAQLGFQITEIDLDGKDEAKLRSLLADKDIIYVQGGDTFWLLKLVKESGFEKMVREQITKGVIYIGVSAGSYICCPTIEMSFWRKEQTNTFGLTDFNGMNLVPFLLSVHYKPEYKDLLKEKIKTTKYPVKILTDDQAILVEDDKYTLVGKGEEIKL